jgi:hypothetical protein
MKLRGLSAALMALLLLVPAASAYGAEPANQEVNVHVLPVDTLSISVQEWADFGGMVAGETRNNDFGLNILNTTAGGWEVTVTGSDLTSFIWEGCDENGCYGAIDTEPLYTIPKASLVVNGGDLGWFDTDGQDAIVSTPGSPGDIGLPTTILQAIPAAQGEFMLDSPMASLSLTIPADAQPMQMYHTTLVYTIAPWTAP